VKKFFAIAFRVLVIYLLAALIFLVLAPLMYVLNLVAAIAYALTLRDYPTNEFAESVSDCWRDFCSMNRRMVRTIWEWVL